MKILFISEGGNSQDYQRDCCFHGLRSLVGENVVDVNPLLSMYQGADRSQMYGKGFTLYAELPNLEVDRSDILRKIANRYFDVVIYGSIHRNRDYLHEVVSMYEPQRIWAIDGEDHPGHLSGLGMLTFKRELFNPQPNCYPIHFAVPKHKIAAEKPKKHVLMAPCDPLNRKTYIYNDEASYYGQYASAYFAPTMKKAGWDCLRHYEILSQWALPYFRVFDQCPSLICHHLPRPELLLLKNAIEYVCPGGRLPDWKGHEVLEDLYYYMIHNVMAIVKAYLTTEALALYMFDTIGIFKKSEVSIGA